MVTKISGKPYASIWLKDRGNSAFDTSVSIYRTTFDVYQYTQQIVYKRIQSQSQSYLTTDSQSASLSWCQAIITPRDQIFFFLEIFFRQLRVCYFLAPSLTRGRVCNLLLLQGLASAIPLGSESCGTRDHILLSQFMRLLQPGWPGPCVYIPQE
jgi:hypothetical protein